MANFANVVNGIVEQVISVHDSILDGNDFPESEPIGQAHIASIGLYGEWLQTSETGEYRGKLAGRGDLWDGETFINPDIAPAV